MSVKRLCCIFLSCGGADRKISGVSLTVLVNASWQPVEKQFSKSMTQFHLHRKAVEKEAGLANLIEQ